MISWSFYIRALTYLPNNLAIRPISVQEPSLDWDEMISLMFTLMLTPILGDFIGIGIEF